jgi:hypothetical protein
MTLPELYGTKVITNQHLEERQLIRMCKSKKERIKRKWLKNNNNYRFIPDPKIYKVRPPGFPLFGGIGSRTLQEEVIIGHPATIARLRRIIDEQ